MRKKNECVIHELLLVFKDCDYTIMENQINFLMAIDQLCRKIPVMELIDYLIGDFYNNNWLEFVAQAFIKCTSLTREDKIIALELIGAYVLIHLFDSTLPEVAMQCWKDAMTLRYSPTEGELLLPKTPLLCERTEASSVVFDSTVEVMSMEDIDIFQEEIENDFFSHYYFQNRKFSSKEVQIPALLVIRRICSQANLERPYGLYLDCLLMFCMEQNDLTLGVNEDSKLLTNLFLLILEQLNGFDPKKISRQSSDVFMKTLGLMSTYFFTMLTTPPDNPGRRELTYANLLAPTKFIAEISKYFPNPGMMSSRKCLVYDEEFARIVYRFLCVLFSISPNLTNEEKQKLEDYYSQYIRNFFPEREATVLHVAVSGFWFDECFHLHIIKLILKLGADPNAIDEDGQTSLHILAGAKSFHFDHYKPVFQALVNAGGHLDMANNDGDTVLSILKRNLKEFKQGGLIVDPYFESLINTVFPLSCLAARVIRRHGIRFDEDRLPPPLQAFVQRHSDKDFTD